MVIETLRCPDELAEALVMKVKALVGILLGLHGEQEEGPIAPLHEQQLPPHLPEDPFSPFILGPDLRQHLLRLLGAGVDIGPDPVVLGVLPDREV
jgi:hypothetical protein